MMARIENGWFYEFINVYHGQAMSLQVEDVLLQEKSKFQDILIFERYLLVQQVQYGKYLRGLGVLTC